MVCFVCEAGAEQVAAGAARGEMARKKKVRTQGWVLLGMMHYLLYAGEAETCMRPGWTGRGGRVGMGSHTFKPARLLAGLPPRLRSGFRTQVQHRWTSPADPCIHACIAQYPIDNHCINALHCAEVEDTRSPRFHSISRQLSRQIELNWMSNLETARQF